MEIAPGSPVDALVIEPFHRECAKPDNNSTLAVIRFGLTVCDCVGGGFVWEKTRLLFVGIELRGFIAVDLR